MNTLPAMLILADDNPATRSALAFVLSRRLGLSVFEEAASAAELSDLLAACSAEGRLVILDWDLPGLRRALGLTELRALYPRVCFVVMSARADEREPALAAGAAAFINMAEPPEVLLATLRSLI